MMEDVAGTPIMHWHNIELPKLGQLRADMLGETADGELIHIELQSTNDPLMALRMAEYALHIYRLFGRFPRQVVLYVGRAEMNMTSELVGPQFAFRYKLMDIRSLDSEPLLQSPWIADNIMAILTRLSDEKAAVRRILARVAALEPEAKKVAIAQLLVLSGLRKLESTIRTELETMPIEEDIMDHEIIGPAIRQGMQQGKQEESLYLVRRLLEKRFGSLPLAVEQRLVHLPVDQLEDLSLRLLDAGSLDELFND